MLPHPDAVTMIAAHPSSSAGVHASILRRAAAIAACSLQHGQKAGALPAALLGDAGFSVRTPAEAHLCCGSAGTYNILQPAIARQLGDRKVQQIEALRPDVIATTNIGCAVQIAGGTDIPVVHVVELLDWATGGPKPGALAAHSANAPA